MRTYSAQTNWYGGQTLYAEEVWIPEETVITESTDFLAPGEDYGLFRHLIVELVVTGVTGESSPALDVTLEDSLDGETWYELDGFSKVEEPGTEVLRVAAPFTRNLRLSAKVSGDEPEFELMARAVLLR